MSDRLLRLVGSYLAWEGHLSSHYCKVATGEGTCDSGGEILRRLHTAYYALTADERADAFASVRDWDWESESVYGKDDA